MTLQSTLPIAGPADLSQCAPMKHVGRVSFTATGLLLLPWPWFVFFGLLAADPFHPKTMHDAVNASMWFVAAAYPMVWLIAWVAWLNTSRERLVPYLIVAPYVVIAMLLILDVCAHYA